jgi:hypothetical protein
MISALAEIESDAGMWALEFKRFQWLALVKVEHLAGCERRCHS